MTDWQRIIDRWGVGVAIHLARVEAERRTLGPNDIPSYLDWKRAQDAGFFDAHPENRPTNPNYSMAVRVGEAT